ncbi:hypothetical protein ONJ23_26030, partial [Salmonella enterica subsp. enterica serovar Virginia]|nr:hypothetical protein [Salmonella enterica subsp. enterica serovar Virginia]
RIDRDVINALIAGHFADPFSVLGMHQTQAGLEVRALLPDATDIGLPAGVPVISAGHDTQFALFGAGAQQGEPVLSSGTWEILMVR